MPRLINVLHFAIPTGGANVTNKIMLVENE